ncbi:hypothetical protein [Halorussus lipolyticus]|uniref:hypothetical protein n=1 Tax=Halorussus lipolyticus TaxID=3034024 RepID=UPI0023E812A5|nr:hypothetical protein [Halorussus sp. DT80]
MRDNWIPTLTLVGLGVLVGFALGEVSLVSGIRRYTGRKSVALTPELLFGALVVVAALSILLVGLVLAAGD